MFFYEFIINIRLSTPATVLLNIEHISTSFEVDIFTAKDD